MVATVAMAVAAGQSPSIKTSFVGFGRSPYNAVLYEPAAPSIQSRIGMIFTHTRNNNAGHFTAGPLASRGYRMLMLSHTGETSGYEGMALAIGASVQYLRGLPGIEKVVLLSTSAGGPVMAFYQNVAENGIKACNGPEKIYPCSSTLAGLPKADGLVLLDSHLGAGAGFLTYVDPAIESVLGTSERKAALDMFSASNGYDVKTKGASYSEAFLQRFFEAQAGRNAQIIAQAQARLRKIEKGEGMFSDDEPFVVAGQGTVTGARPLAVDVRLVARTRGAHPILKADGTMARQVAHSSRPPQPAPSTVNVEDLRTMELAATNTTVRRFLADAAIRTTKEYGMTADAITGIDWKSSSSSLVGNIEGVSVPTLLMAAGCHYFLVSNEMAYERSGSKDKEFVVVEGATHSFNPCRPQFGDTAKRTYDYVGSWLDRRFGGAEKRDGRR